MSTTITIDLSQIASIRMALSTRLATPESLAQLTPVDAAQLGCSDLGLLAGCDVEDDILILDPELIYADDGNSEVAFPGLSAEEAAQEYVDGGAWGASDETAWIDVVTYRLGLDADGNWVRLDQESHTIELQPAEPDCDGQDDHDWQAPLSVVGGLRENPGVHGHGGGVVLTRVCAHCGAYQITDTWAQRRDTGEQGLTSVRYEPADAASLAWLAAD